jgi:nucleoside-diphosphate-sugar epimerase
MQKRVLMTGSEGVLGLVLKRALASDYCLIGMGRRKLELDNYYSADISDLESLRQVFLKAGTFDAVIHLAGDPRDTAPWESILKNNIIGLRNIYELAKQFSIPRVIFASSNHTTGCYEGIPPALHKQENPPLITIHSEVRPDSDYGSAKVYGEALARQFYDLYGIQSICLRIGTVRDHDDPTREERHMKTWLSHRDLVQLVRKSLESDVEFGIYYGVSDNTGRFWDISNAEKELGYKPEDNAAVMKKRMRKI